MPLFRNYASACKLTSVIQLFGCLSNEIVSSFQVCAFSSPVVSVLIFACISFNVPVGLLLLCVYYIHYGGLRCVLTMAFTIKVSETKRRILIYNNFVETNEDLCCCFKWRERFYTIICFSHLDSGDISATNTGERVIFSSKVLFKHNCCPCRDSEMIGILVLPAFLLSY